MALVEKTVDVGGLPVHYWEGGQSNGRTLLLLPSGIGDARANWQTMLPMLAEEFHVIAPDLPGYAGSAPLPQMEIEALVNWVRDLLDTLEIGSAVVVGSFMGALLARLFAAAEPSYVPAVILANGGTIPELPPRLKWLMRLPVVSKVALDAFARISYSRRTVDHMVYVKEALSDELVTAWRDNRDSFLAMLRVVLDSSYTMKLTPLMPALLLWGTSDSLMGVDAAEALKASIPGAMLVLLEECGSLPQLEASETFGFQVSTFLDRISRVQQPLMRGAGMLRAHSP